MKIILALVCFLSLQVAQANQTVVTVQTNLGSFDIELDAEKAPITVENFLTYVNEKFYDGTIFHRAIQDFVVQGGGHLPDMTEKETHAPIINEAKNGLSNLKWTVGMARTDVIDSATSQFFINTTDNLFLDYKSKLQYGYAVFGKVISGFKVVEAIEYSATKSVGKYDDVPVTPIIVESIRLK